MANEQNIQELISRFAEITPVIFEAGTPVTIRTPQTDAVIEFGADAIQPLLDATGDKNPAIVMNAVYCLGSIGDKNVAGSLQELQKVYISKPEKDTDDFAVLSSLYLALTALGVADTTATKTDATATACDCKPKKITLVKDGDFKGGKTMDDYYPDLKGKGYYDHPGKAGPFDTGSRVGANIQIVGEVEGDASKCKVTQELFVETENINGNTDRQGKTYDDIKKSGRDATKAPFKQDFNGQTSFADPPSYGYGPTTNITSKRVFTSCVVGCDGKTKCCVKWSLEIIVVKGVVTKNEVKEIENKCS